MFAATALIGFFAWSFSVLHSAPSISKLAMVFTTLPLGESVAIGVMFGSPMKAVRMGLAIGVFNFVLLFVLAWHNDYFTRHSFFP